MVSGIDLSRGPRDTGDQSGGLSDGGRVRTAGSSRRSEHRHPATRRSRARMTGAAILGTEQASKNSYVLLHVGNRRFALRSELVEELAPPVRLHHFPNTTALVAGVIVRRGRIVPVYDVSRVLCGRESSVHRFYLVARRKFGKESEASAIPVNGECELTNSELVAAGSDDAAYFSGSLQVGEEEIKVLNLEPLVSASTEAAPTAGKAEGRQGTRWPADR